MRIIHAIVIGGLFVSSIGCSQHPKAVDWPEARMLGKNLPSYRAPKKPTETNDAKSIIEPENELQLSDAFALSLLHNPELQMFAWEIRIKEAKALQASLLPNPELEVEIEEFGGSGNTSGFDSAETTLLVSQLIELGHKRQKRIRVGELNQDLAAWDYEAARVVVLVSVANSFIQTLALQEQVELATKNHAIAMQAYQAIAKRVDAGAASTLDKGKASVVVARAKIELQKVRRELESARLELSTTWGNKSPRFEKVIGDITKLKTLPTINELSSVITDNPKLARWTIEIAQRRAMIELQRSKASSDVTLGVGVKQLNETNDTAAIVQLSLPLQIFDRNQGGVLASRYELIKAYKAKEVTELRIGADLAKAYQRMAASYEEVLALQSEVVPVATRTYNDTNTAYSNGKVGYLEVLDAQRTLFETQNQLVKALSSYHQSVVTVEGLIGRSIDDLKMSNETTKQTN